MTSHCLSSAGVVSFFLDDPAATEIYTLSLHDALPISSKRRPEPNPRKRTESRRQPRALGAGAVTRAEDWRGATLLDRKSTRLNSSHVEISYAVFCLKKKII